MCLVRAGKLGCHRGLSPRLSPPRVGRADECHSRMPIRAARTGAGRAQHERGTDAAVAMVDLSHIQVVLRPISSLIAYARNARTHSDAQVAQVAASIVEFGWTSPILIGTDGVIIAGHARLLAARKLGMDEVPVIVLDHLSEAQRRALVIADNRLSELAGWDDAVLAAELAALEADGFDLGVTGFTEADLVDLLANPEQA